MKLFKLINNLNNYNLKFISSYIIKIIALIIYIRNL